MGVDLAMKFWGLARPRVLVVGDSILDVDVHGVVDRYDPAFPGVPVFLESHRAERPGGASAVAAMCAALGADVDELTGGNTVKARHHVAGRCVFRSDHESPSAGGPHPAIAGCHVRDADAVLVADYGKGLCSQALLAAVIHAARRCGVPVIVDPARGRDWGDYRGAACVKCNRVEREESGCAGRWTNEGGRLVVTDGEAGLVHFPAAGRAEPHHARPRRAIDPTGCGDMALASLGVAVAGGMTWPEALTVAVSASGLKVERQGAVPVDRAEVALDLCWPSKLLPAELLPAVRSAGAGRRVVLAGGCFDVFHAGHLSLLREAKAQGDVLVVALNSDASVKRLKGPSRPVVPQSERADLLAALEMVDWVVIFDEDDPHEVITALRPGVLVKGSDYAARPVPEAALLSAWGGRLHLTAMVEGRSTTRLLATAVRQ